MKTTFRHTRILGILILATLSLFTGCKKNKNGVIETHTYITTVFGDTFERGYMCYVISEKSVSMEDGEVVAVTITNELDGSQTTTEYVYWENQSATKLGYTQKNKLESKTDVNGYTSKMAFSTGSDSPGENGYWGASSLGNFSINDIVGHWKHDGSGLEIQINSGSSGYATVLEPGSAFPAEADGGQCMIDINYQGDGEWTGMYRTYYPGNGWQNSSTVIFYMSSNKQSFVLGGATYNKI